MSNMSRVIVFLSIIRIGLQGQLQRHYKLVSNKQMLNLKQIMGNRLRKISSKKKF